MNRSDRRHLPELHVPIVGQPNAKIIPQRVKLKIPKEFEGQEVQDCPFEGWAITSALIPTGFLHVLVDRGDRTVRLAIPAGDVDYIYQEVE